MACPSGWPQVPGPQVCSAMAQAEAFPSRSQLCLLLRAGEGRQRQIRKSPSSKEGTQGSRRTCCGSPTHPAVTPSCHSGTPSSNVVIPVTPLVSGYHLHLLPTHRGHTAQYRLLQGETSLRSLGNLYLYFCFSYSEVSACSWRSQEPIDFPCQINTGR